jgi:hypothetical protein
MACSTYNFPSHTKGDTFDGVEFTLLVNNTLVDLTGAIILMDLRLEKDGAKIEEFTSVGDANITISSPGTLGVFTFNNQTIDVTAARYYYDIEIEFQDGTKKTYIRGTWQITQDVTYE